MLKCFAILFFFFFFFAILFFSGPYFVRTLHYDLSILGGPTWHGHGFIELDEANWQVR